ncbi:MAG: bifunctional folylpolyglutamate synthase/dihydrofolate synthase [Solirubrobacterales bacterium]
MRALTSVLGMPQRRYASIHVVGTNGKSSVTTLTAALLERGGLRAGAYLSPHAERWSERVLIGGAEIGERDFAVAVERVAQAIPAVERGLKDGDVVTQFEAATAAAFVAFAAAGVEVAVVEAGLGGRLDATNVLSSRVTALTSIGLEHTQYLGESALEIAGEKLDVLSEHSALVIGTLPDEVEALARRTAAERHARVVDASGPVVVPAFAGRGPYLARNLAVALAAAQEIAGPLPPELAEEVASTAPLPGRVEVRHGDPDVVFDAAHNPHGAGALAEALADIAADRPIVACIAILEGKNAEGILAALAPCLAGAVLTEVPPGRLQGSGRPGSASIAAGELRRLALAAGIPEAEAVGEPGPAIARAIERARERSGVALVAGSHYLLRYGS